MTTSTQVEPPARPGAVLAARAHELHILLHARPELAEVGLAVRAELEASSA